MDLYPEKGVTCASEQEIDEWTEYKQIVVAMIVGAKNDRKVDGSFVTNTINAIGTYPLKSKVLYRQVVLTTHLY